MMYLLIILDTAAVGELALSPLLCIALTVFVKHYSHFKQLSNITATFRKDGENDAVQFALCAALCPESSKKQRTFTAMPYIHMMVKGHKCVRPRTQLSSVQ